MRMYDIIRKNVTAENSQNKKSIFYRRLCQR